MFNMIRFFLKKIIVGLRKITGLTTFVARINGSLG